jgi:integrase
MRVGEVIRLDRSDIDWANAVVLVRQSKFGKSRHVPLTPSALDALSAYAARRAQFRPLPGNPSFFVSLTGRRLIYVSVHEVFRELCANAGIGAGATTRPRIHDYADPSVMPISARKSLQTKVIVTSRSA